MSSNRKCSNCGKVIPQDSKICHYCSTRFSEKTITIETKKIEEYDQKIRKRRSFIIAAVIFIVVLFFVIVILYYSTPSPFFPLLPDEINPEISLIQDTDLNKTGGFWVNYTVQLASSDAKWKELRIMINDTDFSIPTETDYPIEGKCGFIRTNNQFSAGDRLICHLEKPINSGCKLKVIHIPTDSTITTKTIR